VIPEWLVQVLIIGCAGGILIWRGFRKNRSCLNCRHYSRNAWPKACHECEELSKWEKTDDVPEVD